MMRRGLRVLVCVAAVLVTSIATTARLAAAPWEPGIPRTPEFQNRVDAAIGRGVAWLRSVQTADGSFDEFGGNHLGATTAIAYLTMRVCGVPRDDRDAARAWDALVGAVAPAPDADPPKRGRRRGAAVRPVRGVPSSTYTAALFLMAIAEHGDRDTAARDDHDVRCAPEDRKWAEAIARAVAAAQNVGGTWTYDVPQAGGYGPAAAGGRSGPFDHSNTQYALLGLKAAARCGVEIDGEVWERSLVHFVEAQEATGPEVRRREPGGNDVRAKGRTSAPVVDHARGWGYGRGRGDAYASMTAGGVSSVVICRSELMGTRRMTATLDADSERAAWDGLAWLGTKWSPTSVLPADLGGVKLPPRVVEGLANAFNDYEYYGVERAGVLAGVDWMADRDWYGAGAEPILHAQRPDGSWRGSWANGGAEDHAGEVIGTCFALLFLKRGTTPVRLGGVTRAADDTDLDFAVAAKLQGRDFDDFVDVVLLRWRRATDDGVRRRLFDGATSVGPKIVVPLLVRMDCPDAERRTAAHALLRHATGLDFGYDPAAADADREPKVVAWQAWWLANGTKLAYDPASMRLVVR